MGEKKESNKPEKKEETTAQTKKVIVYSAEWCPWCHKAMDFLKEHKVNFEMRDVSKNPAYAKEVVEKSGQTGIPVIVIGDEAITGFNLPAIKKALDIA